MEEHTRASSWRSKLFALVGITLTILIAACSEEPEDAFVESSRCYFAGTTLNEPFLTAAAKYWFDNKVPKDQLNNRDLLIGVEKLQKEIAPDGTRTSTRTILDVADKWKRSDYCQKVIAEFKQEVPRIIAKAATPQSDNRCDSLRWQLDVMRDSVLGKPKDQVMPGLIGTVNNALASFHPGKQDHLKAEMAKAPEDFVENVVRGCSMAAKGEVTAAINQMETATRFVSQRTKMLRVPDRRQSPDCGDIPEVYCKGDLVRQIAYPLVEKSVACDKEIKRSAECEWSAETVVGTQYLQAEREVLTKAKAGLERYLADPESSEAGFRNHVNALANGCRADAMYKGMRGNALFEYANGTCLPAARQQLLAVKEQTLKKVNARLEQLTAIAPAQPASAAATAR